MEIIALKNIWKKNEPDVVNSKFKMTEERANDRSVGMIYLEEEGKKNSSGTQNSK